MTETTKTDNTKRLTLVYRITNPAQQTKLLEEGLWIASCHTDAMAERDALQRQVQQLQDRVQELGQAARDYKSKAQGLEAQLDAVGAGGVEPLRRGKCLHQIVEPPMKLVEHDEDWLEKMYWEYDAARQKSGDERLSFKGFMRGYGVKCVTDAAVQRPDTGMETSGIDSPFNACMYRDQCRQWKADAQASLGQPVVRHLPADDTEGGAV